MDENVAIVNVSQKLQHVTVSAAGGLRGLTGPKGEPGAGLAINGSVDTYSELPDDLGPEDAGKAWFNQDDGKLYVWTGTRFPAEGQGSQFEGPEGPEGPTGFSPVANVSKVGDTTTITITDKEGTTTATVQDGTQLTDGIINGAANDAATVTGSKIALSTVGTPNLRDNAVTSAKLANDSVTASSLALDVVNRIYPVGSIYMSATMSTASQVEAALGGTWVAWGSGRVPVGVDTTQTEFDTSEKTGGSKTHHHPLSNNGAAAFRNYSDRAFSGGGATNVNSLWKMDGTSNSVFSWTHNADGLYSTDLGYTGVRLYGRTDNVTALQPYITCYMYKRTA